jgi:cyclophilin family peptidyl-prolyl cis-trans isomerase
MKINYFNKILFVNFLVLIAILFSSCGKKEDLNTIKQDIPKKTDNITQKEVTKVADTIKKTDDKVITDTTKSKDKSKETNTVVIETSMGDITIELYEADAPLHVKNFKKLVTSKFYEGTTFHRVINGFMIQGGDPNSKDDDRSNDGIGGPGYTIPAEIKLRHEKGSLAAARLGDAQNPKKESSGSQFYIVTGEASHLDGQYSVYGKVIKGLDIADKIQKVKVDGANNPIDKVLIKKVSFK